MSDSKLIEYNSPLPAEFRDSLDILQKIQVTAEMNRSLAYWMMGRVLWHMKDAQGIENPKQQAAAAIGVSERLLGYCMMVHAAYDWTDLYRLARNLKIPWHMLREMATPRVEPHRANLIAMLEAKTATKEEVADQVARLQSTVRAGTGDEESRLTDGNTKDDLFVKMKKMTGNIRRTSTKLAKAAETAVVEFRGGGEGLIDALVTEDGAANEDAEKEVAEMIKELKLAVCTGAELLYRSSLASLVHHWPFRDLDDMLERFRATYGEDGELVDVSENMETESDG